MTHRRRTSRTLGLALAALAAVALGTTASATGEVPTAEVAPYLDLQGWDAPQVGRTVRVVRGIWNGGPVDFTTTWERCVPATSACTAIAGASSSTYSPVAADVGSALRARVTANGTGGRGDAVTATSGAVTAETVAATVPATTAPAATTTAGGPSAAAACSDGLRLEGLPTTANRPFGGRFTLQGRLVPVTATAVSVAGVQVVLRDPLGAVAATSSTDAGGAFTVTGATAREGHWNVEAAGCRASVMTTLRPVVRVDAVSRRVRAPGVVRIAGIITPRVSGKLVDLQYLVPGRGWRLWHQVHTGPGGTFALERPLTRNPAAPRFRLRIRVAVPTDHGWPFGPATSAAVSVAVR